MPDEEILDNNENDDTPTTTNDEEDNDMANDPNPLGKLQRSHLLHYLETTFDTSDGIPSTPAWYLIGTDVEDMSVELNPDTTVVKNILDETSVQDNGYEPSVSVETYYANPTDGAIYTKLKDIMMNRKTGDACKTYLLEVLIDTDGSSHSAWAEEVIVKPTSYGGAQGGVRIPFTISFAGNRQAGTATITNKVPTFTAST